MGVKKKCYVGLTDMLTGQGFTHVKEYESKTDAWKYIREQGIKGIPKGWRGRKLWVIRDEVKEVNLWE